MEFLNTFMLPVILGICLCVGYVVKKWIKDIDNRYIPTIVTVLGVILSAWIADWNLTPEVLLEGMISGLASTGFHQIFKQFIEARTAA
ncbi:MAG: holin [Lachnospiraceae bacterium]|nr:holin [Lachnospiraceae bacterium]